MRKCERERVEDGITVGFRFFLKSILNLYYLQRKNERRKEHQRDRERATEVV